MADLVTSAYVQSCAAAGGIVLSSAQLSVVTSNLISLASRLIRAHCNRYFNETVHDGLYTVDHPSRQLLLRQYPVNSILRIASSPEQVLQISNTDTVTNQRAYVTMLPSGNTDEYADMPSPVTTLKLVRLASGVATTSLLTLSSYPTVQALANAINGLGAGWTTYVDPEYALWPVLDPENAGLCYFRPIQSAVPCLGNTQAGLVMHTDDLDFQLDELAGLVLLPDQADVFDSARFGFYLSDDLSDLSSFGGAQGVRVIYDAGWATVPEVVQQCAVEVILDALNLCNFDQRVSSVNDGDFSFTRDTAFAAYALPKSVIGKLNYYRNTRA